MAIFFAGQVLKQIRESKQITQDQVCVGICDKGTLSRVEKGISAPNSFVFTALIERLGLEANKYFFSVQNKKEIKLKNAINELEGLIANGRLDEAESRLEMLELKEELTVRDNQGSEHVLNNNIEKQILLRLKIAVKQKKKEPPKALQEMVINALKLTIPHFCEDKTRDYLLTYNEITLLNMLSDTYCRMAYMDKAIGILFGVKDSMDRYYTDEYEKSRGYILTLFNLSSTLFEAEKYKLAIHVCDTAIANCIDNRYLLFLPKLAFTKACSLFKTGADEKEYREMIIRAYYTLLLYGDEKSAYFIKDTVEKEHIMKWNL